MTRATLGEIRDEPRALRLFEDLAREGTAIARAHGVELEDAWLEQFLKHARSLPA